MEEYEALELSSSICTPVWNALELFGAQDNLLDGSNKSFFYCTKYYLYDRLKKNSYVIKKHI
jgi:hypothetical protein